MQRYLKTKDTLPKNKLTFINIIKLYKKINNFHEVLGER